MVVVYHFSMTGLHTCTIFFGKFNKSSGCLVVRNCGKVKELQPRYQYNSIYPISMADRIVVRLFQCSIYVI